MRLLTVLLLACLMALTSCAEPALKTYSFTPIPTPGGRLCTGQCGDAQDYCAEGCGLKQRTCTNHVQAMAIDDYDKYTREQFTTHEPIELMPRDFERMAPCDEAKKTCMTGCETQYRSCYQDCGGKVETMTSCQFFCF